MVVVIRNSFHSANSPGIGFGSKPLSFAAHGARRSATIQVPPVVSFFHKVNLNGSDITTLTATSESSMSTNHPVKTSGGFNPTLVNETRRSSAKKSSVLQVVPPSRRLAKKRKVLVSVTRSSTCERKHQENILFLPVQKTAAVLSRASGVISRRTYQFLEEVEESRRQATKMKRISQCLLQLKAASERSTYIRSHVSKRSEPSQLKVLVGDMGLALFSPLDPDAFEQTEAKDMILPETGDKEEAILYPVDLATEPSWVVISCPRILTPRMIQQFMDQALPPSVKTMQWRRIFALGRDGDSFLTMIDHCEGYSNTLLVVETTKGCVIGGFAAAPWKGGGRSSFSGSEFFGNGLSFLFSSHSENPTQMDPLRIYKWTGSNTYCQICDDGQLAMGGGGAFGLIIDDNFSRGTTGRCNTFGNEPLVPELGGTFDIVNFEVYGFASLAEVYLGSPIHALQGKRLSLLSAEAPL
jgi:hypothetical protein